MPAPFQSGGPPENAEETVRRRTFWVSVIASSVVIFGMWIWLLPTSLAVQGGATSLDEWSSSLRDSEIVKRAGGLKEGLSDAVRPSSPDAAIAPITTATADGQQELVPPTSDQQNSPEAPKP